MPAVVGFDQVTLYMQSFVIGPVVVSLGNCLFRNTSGSASALSGFRSVAGKLSTSKFLNRLTWLRSGPPAAIMSAFGMAHPSIMMCVFPVVCWKFHQQP